ncbi:MAG: S-layer homology domain-containing protein [Monoglobaceae bacterium]
MKKILSVILVVIQLLTVTAFADTVQLTDGQKEDLYNLGIMIGDENGDLRLNDNITRAEAAKMMCISGNISLPSDVKENIFNDVAPGHWAYKYIYAAKEHDIVNGDGNGNFRPESNITNEEIVKMIVCLLGYSEMAEMNGGYPAGYTATATRIGITSNLNLKTKTPAIRNDVAIMISNALDTPIMVEKSEGEDENGGVAYVILDGKNGIPFASIRGTRGMTWDTSLTNIDRLAQDFASQYPYKEGDTEKSIELYPGVTCMLGMEKTADGVEYECPAIYDDRHAYDLVNTMLVVPAKLVIKDSSYEIQCAVFNSKVLVPYDIFKLAGCNVLFNKDTYVAAISKGDTTLEIIPNIFGMRKNQAEGYWVPLEVCARFVNDTLYVPLDAVAKEFGYISEINSEENVITIK